MRRLKIGVIGLGEVAQIIHLPILESLADKFEIAALCDISPQLLQVMGQKYRVERLYTDAAQLTSLEDLDAVFVLNSDEYHAECAIMAANNKKHILLEKPMCLSNPEADAIIQARDEGGVQIMVGYMRRYAPAFTQALEELKTLGPIQFVKVRDIIGQNRQFIEQSSRVHRYNDIPEEAILERSTRAAKLVEEALGDVPQHVKNSYRLLCGLNSHDLSAMRELIGMPNRVVSAAHWKDGYYLTAIFEYDDYCVSFETGVNQLIRFDAHIEIFGESKSLKIQYDTPYIRHLPTTLTVSETVNEAFEQTVHRPTYKDAYTVEIEAFYEMVTKGLKPKTSPEDYKHDLQLFKMICDALTMQY